LLILIRTLHTASIFPRTSNMVRSITTRAPRASWRQRLHQQWDVSSTACGRRGHA
jgi:hypothetical protein